MSQVQDPPPSVAELKPLLASSGPAFDSVDLLQRTSGGVARCAIPIVVAVLLGIALRFTLLGYKSLWEDEAETFKAATYGSLLTDHALDPHPLSVYVLYNLLGPLVTWSEAAMRVPPAIASCIGLMLWPLCLKLFGFRAELRTWAVLLLAVLPMDLWFAQEARAYAFAVCLAIVVLTAYSYACLNRSWGSLIPLALAAAASSHIDGIGMAVPGTLVLVSGVAAIRRAQRAAIPVALIAGLLLASPYYIFRAMHILQAGEIHAPGTEATTLSQLLGIGLQLSPFGFRYMLLDRVAFPRGAGRVALVTLLTLLVVATWWRPGHRLGRGLLDAGLALSASFIILRAPRWFSVLLVIVILAAALTAPRRWLPRGGLWTLVTLAALPAAAFAAACFLAGFSPYERYLVITIPAMVALVVLGTMRFSGRAAWPAYAVLLAAPLACSIGILMMPYKTAEHRKFSAMMLSQLRPGDGLINETCANYPLFTFGPLRAYAWKAGTPIPQESFHEFDITTKQPAEVRITLSGHELLPADEAAGLTKFIESRPSGRVWVMTAWITKFRRLDLAPLCRLSGTWEFQGIEVALWERNTANGEALPPQ